MFKKLAVYDILDNDDNNKKGDTIDAASIQKQLDALQASNEELMKANKGLLKDLQGERQNRQQFQNRFESLSTTVQGVVDSVKNKQEGDAIKAKATASPQTGKGLPVEIDENGNAFVADDAVTQKVKGITGQYEEAINGLKAENQKLVDYINQINGSKQVQDQFEKTVNSIVGEKAGFSQAKAKLDNLRGVINQAVSQYQTQLGLEGYFTPAQVLDLLDGDLKDFANEFSQANPGLDIERVVRGYESQRDLRSTLNHLSGLDAEVNPKTDDQSTVGEQFKKVLQKPGTLTNTSNQKDAKGDPWANLTEMSGVDLLDNMTDADAAKLEAALLKQELDEN